ncbi:FabD/lysophospholipase-like protein, partial [Rhizoctonia solani]
SVDNGGLRGLSALLLVDEVMKRMQNLEGLDYTPEPHEYFDLIAGTGTGGIQACMLGRLRMPLNSAIESYAKLVSGVISDAGLPGYRACEMTELKNSLREIVRNMTGGAEEPMMEQQSTSRQCKTLVFAMSMNNLHSSVPILFRSYPATADPGPNCAIWESLCATMAHQDLFDNPIKIDEPPLTVSLVNPGHGCNNPLVHVLTEAKRMYPMSHVASVLSIGAGHTSTIPFLSSPFKLNRYLPMAVIVIIKAVATDTERMAEDMAECFSSTEGVYFRLNINQGVQDVRVDGWERPSEVVAHTRAYTSLENINARLSRSAQAIQARRPAVPMSQIGTTISNL